jgi:molybdopterin-binding protein
MRPHGSAEQLGLLKVLKGDTVTAVIKSTEVMLAE